MNIPSGRAWRVPNWRFVVPSLLVLAVCLFYTGAAMYLAPYPGFDWGPDWVVTVIESCEVSLAWCIADQNTLQVNDQLLVIGDLSYDEYLADKSKITFEGYESDDTVPITLLRDGEELVVKWQMLGPTDAARVRRLIDILPLYLPFWLAGTVILLLLRPRDLRWWLLILFNYVTALWLAVGTVSIRGVAFASPIQHALAWLFASISLHLHLTVPTPFFRQRRRYAWPIYASAVVLAVLELFQALPGTAYFVGLLLAFLGSVGLLLFRMLARNSQDRLAARLMLIGIGMAFGPAVVLWIVPVFLMVPLPTGLTFSVVKFAIPLLPFFYLYAIYKRRLSTLEFRANRLLGTYAFFLLYAILFLLVLLVGGEWLGDLAGSVGFPLLVSAVFVLAAVPLRARFQHWFDRLAYGARYNPDDVLRVFSGRIGTIQSLEALGHLLAGEVAPSLLIRQSALVLLEGEDAGVVYAQGVELSRTLDREGMGQVLKVAGRYLPPPAGEPAAWDWVRLAVSIKVGEELLGVWLFGRRDPDDYYPHDDIELLSALAGQVALACQNAQLVDTLRGLNRELVQVEEAQRKQMARDLHDTALQQLFFVKQQLFHDAEKHTLSLGLLDDTIRTLRRTIRGLRPPLLDQGLPSALQELVDEMQQVAGSSPIISWYNHAEGNVVLSDERATALYRITQESLANALKHAGARAIDVTLEVDDGRVILCVADDGQGLESGGRGEREHHYGLAGMRERAAMIGAQFSVGSVSSGGTRVTIEVPV